MHGFLRSSSALAVLCGAVLLTAPVALVHAQTGNAMADHQSRADAHAETIEQRITTLHGELKITSAEESDWQAVAKTMRVNASAMQKLAATKASESQAGMTAIEDLQTYTDFAQAHADGLKKLTASFQTLYEAMPAEQKKIADQIFEKSQHHESARSG
jgi:hypothetical protein